MEKLDVFICTECGYEDSSFIPMKKTSKTICPDCKKEVTVNIIEMEHGKNLTLKDYFELIKYIDENHSFINCKGKRIKYITNILDFRTGDIHCVRLGDKEFNKVNQNRHRNLKEWIYKYLDN